MPNKLRIFDNNLLMATAATVAVSSAAVTMPGSNMLQPGRQKPWQTATGTRTATAVFDLGAARDVSAFALITSNLGTAGTLTIQGGTADSWGTPAYNSGALAAYDSEYSGLLLYYFGQTKTLRYWRAILDDPGNAQDYVSVGVAWLGTYVEFERNFRYGWQLEPVSLSTVSYAVDGTPYTDELGEYRQITLDVGFLTENFAINTFLPMVRRVAVKKDILLALFPQRQPEEGTAAEQKLILYGRLQAPQTRNTSSWRWGVSLAFRETP